jgi:hypothetical protein
VEFFLECYELIEKDLRRVVETTSNKRKMIKAYNTTFITLIPKEDNSTYFEKNYQYHIATICTKLFQRS